MADDSPLESQIGGESIEKPEIESSLQSAAPASPAAPDAADCQSSPSRDHPDDVSEDDNGDDIVNNDDNDLTESGKEELVLESEKEERERHELEGTESSQNDSAPSSLEEEEGREEEEEEGARNADLSVEAKEIDEEREVIPVMNSSVEGSPSNADAAAPVATPQPAAQRLRSTEEEDDEDPPSVDDDLDLPESERHVTLDPRFRAASQHTMVHPAPFGRSPGVAVAVSSARPRSGLDDLNASLSESLPPIADSAPAAGAATDADMEENVSPRSHPPLPPFGSPMSCGDPSTAEAGTSPVADPSRRFPGLAVSPGIADVRGRSCSPQISGVHRYRDESPREEDDDDDDDRRRSEFPDCLPESKSDTVGSRLAASTSSDSIHGSFSSRGRHTQRAALTGSDSAPSVRGARFSPRTRDEDPEVESMATERNSVDRQKQKLRPPRSQKVVQQTTLFKSISSQDAETQSIVRSQRPADLLANGAPAFKLQHNFAQSFRHQNQHQQPQLRQSHNPFDGLNGHALDPAVSSSNPVPSAAPAISPAAAPAVRDQSVMQIDVAPSAASDFPWEALNDATTAELPKVEEGLSDFSVSDSESDRDSLAAEGIAFDGQAGVSGAGADKDVADSPCYKLPKLRSRSEDQELSSKAHAYNLNSELAGFRRHQQQRLNNNGIRQPERYRGSKSTPGLGAGPSRESVDRAIADIRSAIRHSKSAGFKVTPSSVGTFAREPVWVRRMDDNGGPSSRAGRGPFADRDTTEDEDIQTLAAAAAAMGASRSSTAGMSGGYGPNVPGLSVADRLQLQNHAANQNQASSRTPSTFHHTTSGLDLYHQAQIPAGGAVTGSGGPLAAAAAAAASQTPSDPSRRLSEDSSESKDMEKGYCDDVETDRLVDHEYRRSTTVEIPEVEQSPLKRLAEKSRIKDMRVKVASPDNPTILIEGVLYGARYLGSTQLSTEGRPSKSLRMMQAQEAIARIKAPQGESQPSTDVELFVSTERILVLNTDLQEIMMDHSLRTISYIADIGDIVVLMARRNRSPSSPADDPNGGGGLDAVQRRTQQHKMVCHVFESEEAQDIARAIGQAFQVAYREFLKANGIEDHSFLKEVDYQEVLASQEIFNDELTLFSSDDKQREVVVTKAKGEMVGVVIVESGWGSMLPTVVVANLMPQGAAARSGQLNIGDQLLAINGVSLVGLPLSTCQSHIKAAKSQTVARFSVVPCAPVVEVRLKRPDVRCPLGFSVQNGIICSILRGGLAERGGVRVGHRIIEINGSSVVAVAHEKIVSVLANSVGEIQMKTMPTSIFRLLTGQETPQYI